MIEFIKIILLGPVNDMKKTPGTSLSVIFVWLVIAYAAFVLLPKLATASDMVATQAEARAFKESAIQLQASVSSLNTRLQYDGMRRDMDQLDTEINAVDREITRLARLNSEPNDFLLDRQQRLISRRGELTQKIATLIQTHPELVAQ